MLGKGSPGSYGRPLPSARAQLPGRALGPALAAHSPASLLTLLTPGWTGADQTDEQRFYLGVEKAVLFNTGEEGLTEAEAEERLLKFGKNQLPEKEDNKLMKLALEFVQPMPLMIWAAIFIEARPRPASPLPTHRSRLLCSLPHYGWPRGPPAPCAPANNPTRRRSRRTCNT